MQSPQSKISQPPEKLKNFPSAPFLWGGGGGGDKYGLPPDQEFSGKLNK